mmetsp:Transcript_19865/g.57998  ORF Transcript_19865/g.57998 Transcript_19865/m.57998 type:complete len:967 (-) Transcript_19865:29-2929(-)
MALPAPRAAHAEAQRPRGGGLKGLMQRIPGVVGLSSYLSSSFGGSGTGADEVDRSVLWARFETVVGGDGHLLTFLLLGVDTGFQLWEVSHHEVVRELASADCGAVRSLCLFGAWRGAAEGRPPVRGRLAVLSADPQASKTLRVFSLDDHVFQDSLELDSPVFGALGNDRVLAVVFETQLHCYRASSLSRMFAISTFPQPRCHDAVAALHSRWLAFPTDHFVSWGQSTHQAMDATSAAQGLVSGLYWITAQGQKAAGGLANQVIRTGLLPQRPASGSGRAPPASSPCTVSGIVETKGDPSRRDVLREVAGGVVVLDVCREAIVTQLRAHTEPIVAMCWSPSGDVLVTAPKSGQTLHLFGVNRATRVGEQHTMTLSLRYKLVRGLTPSTIRRLSVSNNGKWVAATSSRGTTHIFAVDPRGGEVDGKRHNPAPGVQTSSRDTAGGTSLARSKLLEDGSGVVALTDPRSYLASEDPPTVTLRSVARIHGIPASDGHEDEAEQPRSWSPGDSVLGYSPEDRRGLENGLHASQDHLPRKAAAVTCLLSGHTVLIAAPDSVLSRYTLRTTALRGAGDEPTVIAPGTGSGMNHGISESPPSQSSPSSWSSTTSMLVSVMGGVGAAAGVTGAAVGPPPQRPVQVLAEGGCHWDLHPCTPGFPDAPRCSGVSMKLSENYWQSRNGQKDFSLALTLRGDALRPHLLHSTHQPPDLGDGLPARGGPTVPGASGREGRQWLSQVETRTHALRSTPAWASPQITFHVFVALGADGEAMPDAIPRAASLGSHWHSPSNPLHLGQRESRELQVVRGSGPGVVVRHSLAAGSQANVGRLAEDLGAALEEPGHDAEIFPFNLTDDEDMDFLDGDLVAEPQPPCLESPAAVTYDGGAGGGSKSKKKKKKKDKSGKKLPEEAAAAASNLALEHHDEQERREKQQQKPELRDHHALSPPSAGSSSPWVLTSNPNSLASVVTDPIDGF